jgi:UDP-sulfoquinovose synthase
MSRPPVNIMRRENQAVLVLGGDGYLGWSLGIAMAHRLGGKVVLVDKLIKRKWEKAVGAKLLVPLAQPSERIRQYERIYRKRSLIFEKVDLLDQEATAQVIRKYRPAAIVNAAQQPSAPYSMMSAKHAAETFSNNIGGHLNALWAVAGIDKSILYIKLGSAGCYGAVNTDYIPLAKTDLSFEYGGGPRKILQSWLPMHATDFYHQSKIADFLIDDLGAELWKLRVITVQQGIIFGATVEENDSEEHRGLVTRFNYDHVFSTVLNRFVCQAVIGHPITVYGEGKQRTVLMSLRDTVNSFINLLHLDVRCGEHRVIHNYTHCLSIREIAEAVKKLRPEARITYLKNPRREPESGLAKQIEVHPSLREAHNGKEEKFMRELEIMIAFTERYKDNIDPSIILPKVRWER